MVILALVGIAVLLPLALRVVRFLVIVHVWAVVLFLPAGLLIRYGPIQDVRLFVGATCAWAAVLVWWRLRGQRQERA